MNALPNPFDDLAAATAPSMQHRSSDLIVSSPSVAETFSEYVARRSLPIVSSPLPPVARGIDEWLIDPQAFFEAIEPPPVCLQQHIRPEFTAPVTQRVPRESFIRALLEVAGDRS